MAVICAVGRAASSIWVRMPVPQPISSTRGLGGNAQRVSARRRVFVTPGCWASKRAISSGFWLPRYCCILPPLAHAFGGNLAQHLPGNDHALNLVGSLEDLGDLGIAHIALHRPIVNITSAAQH